MVKINWYKVAAAVVLTALVAVTKDYVKNNAQHIETTTVSQGSAVIGPKPEKPTNTKPKPYPISGIKCHSFRKLALPGGIEDICYVFDEGGGRDIGRKDGKYCELDSTYQCTSEWKPIPPEMRGKFNY